LTTRKVIWLQGKLFGYKENHLATRKVIWLQG
jgi:hypothetical protein